MTCYYWRHATVYKFRVIQTYPTITKLPHSHIMWQKNWISRNRISCKKCNTIISSDNYQLYICSVTAAAIFLSINGVATFKAMHFLFKDTLWYKMCITWSFFCNFCPSLSHNTLRPKPSFRYREPNPISSLSIGSGHRLQMPGEEIVFTAWPKINSHSQIFRYGRGIFCLPHRPKFSDFYDLWLHWVSVVRVTI